MSEQFRRLVVWQLAREFKLEVYALASRPPACLDRSFADHLRRTAASVELNIVEGAHRDGPRDFARFLSFSRASLAEASAQLEDGIHRGHFQQMHISKANALARRLSPGLAALARSLRAGTAR